ncbi:MAG: hypothetical protein AAF458_15915 [Pseudomonadota bacterium]
MPTKSASTRRAIPCSAARQRGAALLVVTIVAILAAAALLLGEFSGQTDRESDESLAQTYAALRQAREALLGASVANIDNQGADVRPGQLPWPDRAVSDGDYNGESDCRATLASRLAGRFPYLGAAGCVAQTTNVALSSYLEDGAGEPLWYVVSRNVVNFDSSAEPLPFNAALDGNGVIQLNPGLLDSAAHPWLRVCDAAGNLIATNVAAVIIAPGPALDGQSRVGATPAIDQYLDALAVTGGTISNADSDETADVASACGGGAGEDFVAYVGVTEDQVGLFNDRLIYITAEELLEAAQARALQEVRVALETHVATHSRFPWLSPFADATVGSPLLSGTVTALPGTGTGLTDSGAADDFDNLLGAGNLVGAAIRNTTTGATGQVVSVSARTIQTTRMVGGSAAAWSVGDGYQLPTFRGVAGTRFGHLPFHDPLAPEDRRSDFSVAWELDEADIVSFAISQAHTDPHASYTNSLRNQVLATTFTGTVAVGAGLSAPLEMSPQGVCRQNPAGLAAGEAHARCQGLASARVGYLTMDVETADATILRPFNVREIAAAASFSFADWGVTRGALVSNTTDGSAGIALSVSSTPLTLTTAGLSGGTDNTFEVGDVVTVQVPTREIADTSDGGGSATLLVDSSRDFVADGVDIGDIVVKGSGDVARVTAVATNQLGLSGLSGGADPSFAIADSYAVLTDFVASREYTFDLLFTGIRTEATLANELVYSVRSGAVGGSDPITHPAHEDTAGENDPALPYVAIRAIDYDSNGIEIARAEVTLDENSVGYIEVSNIEQDFMLAWGDTNADSALDPDVPRWIFEQGWHEFIAIGVGSQWQPTGVGACTLLGDCLSVNRYPVSAHDPNAAVATTDTTVPAVVVGSGLNLGGTQPSIDPADYFEGLNGNANLDDFEFGRFNRNGSVAAINDRVMIPCTVGC